MMADNEAFRYAAVAEEAACLAGRDIVYEAARQREKGHACATRTKSTFCDLVTDADEKSEKFIMQYCTDKLGKQSVRFVGEESATAGKTLCSLELSGSSHVEHGFHNGRLSLQNNVAKTHLHAFALAQITLTDEPTIIIDPIDGTSNFVHGFPAFVVSVGIAINKKLVAGVIYDPTAGDTFTAVRGHGAFVNHQRPLRVSSTTQLIDALIVGGTGGVRDKETLDTVFDNFRAVNDASHGIRTMGSCAYNLVTIAAGRCDGFFDTGIHCWDVSAGAIIVSEAGGTVRGVPQGSKFDLMGRNVLACNSPEIADALQAVMKPVVVGRDADEVVYAL